MRRLTMVLALLSFGILFISGCKKASKEGEDNPVTPNTAVTNPPPATGDYWMTVKPEATTGNFSVFWTQDFVTYKELSTDLRGTYPIYLSGDTMLFKQSVVSGGVSLRYSPISNPLSNKTVTSSKGAEFVGCVNGTIVVLSQDANNYYRGYCSVQKGETSFQYQLLDNTTVFSGLYRVASTLVTNATLNSTSGYLGYTKDGISWTVTKGPGVSNLAFYDLGATTVAFDGFGRLYKTQGTDFSSAAWTEIALNGANTTDTVGYFDTQFSTFITINDQWKVYGYVNSNVTGQKLPAVNISTNQGATWNTTFLTGSISRLTGSEYPIHKFLASKNLTLIYVGYAVPKVFKSTNGIDFTEFLVGQAATDLNSFLGYSVYVK